jgi:hypothetical protein
MLTTQPTRRFMGLLIAAALAVGTVATSDVVQAQQVPQVLPYQGYLSRADGTPVEGTVSLTFKLYDTANSQTPVWTEVSQNVTVNDGVFYVYLGQQSPILAYFGDGVNRYLGIAVNQDPEATPRHSLGSVPYALLAGNALRLGGNGPEYYVSQQQLANYVTQQQLATYVSETELNQTLATYVSETELTQTLQNYITEEEFVGGNIDLGPYVTEEELQNALANYVTQALLNNYVTDAELTQILNNYVTDAELTQLLGGYVTLNQFNTTVAGLNTDIDNLQNQVTTLQTNYTNLQNQYNTLNQALTNLQTQVTNLQNNNQGGQPYILGVSDTATTGRAEFGGKKGYAAATQMCVSTYGAGAHLCTMDEVNFAISTERWDTNRQAAMQGVFTWTSGLRGERTNANYDDGHQASTCQSFNYASGDIATGQRLRLLFNSPTGGNSGQAQANLIEVDHSIGCNTSLKVLCCKYQ